MAKTAAKPKEDDKKPAAATPPAKGPAAAPTAPADPAASAAQSPAPAAPADKPTPPAAPAPEAVKKGTAKASPELSQGVADVLAERARQLGEKGYSVERDGEYRDGELPMAAACYAVFGAGGQMARSVFSWPFKTEAFRPHDKRRAMVKAAALLLAAIEAGDAAGWDDQAMK